MCKDSHHWFILIYEGYLEKPYDHFWVYGGLSNTNFILSNSHYDILYGFINFKLLYWMSNVLDNRLYVSNGNQNSFQRCHCKWQCIFRYFLKGEKWLNS
jgi:hypothetical protein